MAANIGIPAILFYEGCLVFPISPMIVFAFVIRLAIECIFFRVRLVTMAKANDSTASITKLFTTETFHVVASVVAYYPSTTSWALPSTLVFQPALGKLVHLFC